MAQFPYPFEPQVPELDCTRPKNCALLHKTKLAAGLRSASRKNAHLLRYLHILPLDEIGIPKFKESLDFSDGDAENLNLIYPVSGDIFVHITADPEKTRDYYIAIEPAVDHPELASITQDVETMLLEYTDELENARTPEALREALSAALDRVLGVATTEAPPPQKVFGLTLPAAVANILGSGRNGADKTLAVRWNLDQASINGLKYSLIRDKVGMGVLDPLIRDRYIEDISCSGIGSIFVEHKIFKSLRTTFGYGSYEELDEYVLRLSERIKRPVTFRQPVVDASLPDGSRINIVYGKDLSTRGSNYTIRKFSEDPISILQLCKWGSMSWEMAAYLSLVIEDGLNIFVSGETASGKTTTLNALTTFVAPSAKIVSIEDTAEITVPHKNWIREVIRKAKPGEEDSGVGMFELLKAALRQRPDEIIIGEIRGEEGIIAFQAMQTGHACMATFHAATIQKLIQRLTGAPISVPKNYVDNLNVALIQMAVRLPGGKIGRRVISVNEIISYNSQEDAFSFVEVFRWDPVTDRFEFTGFNNSYVLEQKVAPARGYPINKRRQIYALVQRRARILEKLANSGLEDYQKVYGVLAKAIKEGVF